VVKVQFPEPPPIAAVAQIAISTRRFCRRLSSWTFVAIGSVSPRPAVVTRPIESLPADQICCRRHAPV